MKANCFFAVMLIAGGGFPLCTIPADELPAKYAFKYPPAQQFCPPTVEFFDEVQRTVERVRGRTFTHQPNGGYGLPVVDKVGDKHLLHLGADVGFHRVGDPVFAVANGIVRVSQGPPTVIDQATPRNNRKSAPKKVTRLEWGNMIAIEHELPDGKYATTIYGHLSNDRLVKTGDIVQAGQQIGTIGNTRVNGGYTPHLHLGVREGRLAEVGRKLFVMGMDGKPSILKISELREDAILLTGAMDMPTQWTMGLDGRTFTTEKDGDAIKIDAAFLYYVPSPEFLLVGYGLSADGWLDPTTSLKVHSADVNPAPFSRSPPNPKSKTRVASDIGNRQKNAAATDK